MSEYNSQTLADALGALAAAMLEEARKGAVVVHTTEIHRPGDTHYAGLCMTSSPSHAVHGREVTSPTTDDQLEAPAVWF
ncbi:hypothetical protein [Alkalilimnicola ehrlichii]|uniref:hypothetical protein n=1 Tax=Alkalilimnicola ehrlichii TaxID=351052 RepID=UPI003BA0AADA